MTMLRINKFLAHAGCGSRRQCDEMIIRGRVRINGEITKDLTSQVDDTTDQVSLDDHPIKLEKHVYWVVNKPPGYICSNHDPDGRPLALDLIPHVVQRVYTVGRLDEDSEGLLLLTNDGDLAQQLMHPKYGIEKTYEVQVAGNPDSADLQQLTTGIWLSDGRVKAKFVRKIKSQGNSTWIRIVLAEGKNREIRRMLARLKHKVVRLKRVAIGPIRLDRLAKGKSRKLALHEIEFLRKAVEMKRTAAAQKVPAAKPKASKQEK
ncbi:MAG: pseudouridine synthase [Zavarzinella sp.]